MVLIFYPLAYSAYEVDSDGVEEVFIELILLLHYPSSLQHIEATDKIYPLLSYRSAEV